MGIALNPHTYSKNMLDLPHAKASNHSYLVGMNQAQTQCFRVWVGVGWIFLGPI